MKNLGILLDIDTDDLAIQVKKDTDGKIIQGMQVGDVTMQNIRTILYMQPGELKSHPTVGVGINNMLLDHEYLLYKHKIRQQLVTDGMKVKKLDVTDQNVRIDASYN